jgi:hypothetical protein
MKTKSKKNARFLLKLRSYASYIDDVFRLENILAKKPRRLNLEMIGAGEIPPDTALLLRSIILKRSAKTQLITNARSSLQGAAVLVWLLGDTRLLRDDARFYLRSAGPFAVNENPKGWKDRTEWDADDLEDDDYIRVLGHINEFLPVREIVDQPIERLVLKQFGLIDSEHMDQFLAAAFGKPDETKQRSRLGQKTVKAASG